MRRMALESAWIIDKRLSPLMPIDTTPRRERVGIARVWTRRTTESDKYGHALSAGWSAGTGVNSGVLKCYLAKYAGMAPNAISSPACVGPDRLWHRQAGDRRHSESARLKRTPHQHPRHQHVAGTSGVREYTLDPESIRPWNPPGQAGIEVVVAEGKPCAATMRWASWFRTIGYRETIPPSSPWEPTRTMNTRLRVEDAIQLQFQKGHLNRSTW